MIVQKSIFKNLLRLRWIAITFQSLALVPGIYFNFISMEFVIPYLVVNLALICLNLTYKTTLKPRDNTQDRDLFIQLFVDLIAFSTLLAFSGGDRNPFSALYFIHAALAGILLEKKYAQFYFIGLIPLLSINQYISYLGHGYFYTLFISQWLILCITWVMSRWIRTTLIDQANALSKYQRREYRKDRMNSLGAMAAGLLHELATPLNTIGLTIDHIELKNNNDELKDDLLAINSSLEICESIIHKLHNTYNNLEKTNFRSISPKIMIEQMLPDWRKRFNKIEFTLTAADETDLSISEINLYQALNNFINNSADENATQIDIIINKKEINSESFVSIFLNDNGPGFPQNVLKNFGEPFITNKNNGTGLGLYSSLLIIENMGGNLDITNANGAQIEIQIPYEEES